jgi:hypothetical protein
VCKNVGFDRVAVRTNDRPGPNRKKPMQKLMAELTRLYLPADSVTPDLFAQHVSGKTSAAISLTADDGLTRAMVIAFPKTTDSDEAHHWSRLCAVANAVQTDLGFPPPAVSVSGINGYRLWLSLEAPAPTAQVQKFLELLSKAYFPDMVIPPDAASAPVELPPCMHQSTGKWAAFIHPGMGASFAGESGLEMAPPLTGQTAFLEAVQSISTAQFLQALKTLQQADTAPPAVAGTPAPVRAAAPDGLLLKDATLEDIVLFLHAKNIEPTFRHLLPQPQ